MTCYLLHIMEDPDRDAYRDPDLKDVVGLMPRFFCAQVQPLSPLVASESVKCMRRNAPCWRPTDEALAEDESRGGQSPSAAPSKDGRSSDGSPYAF